eukprot:CAMPEP_0118985140 /NCGR_PEP_ID=MMETSP1173-20130426/39272_1 /TAXON_ID=1034831 /ORGANISM="Rhizochromulina marina cf, Strain CCMP1243" /LENGTH=802 /DNA_ID=CAMNT_0006935841 /DNA_START=6 /DNA_END=2414 /DNA_ORIENTATION=+
MARGGEEEADGCHRFSIRKTRSAEFQPAAQGAEAGPDTVSLEGFVETMGLGQILPALRELGCAEVEDLFNLEAEDIESFGLKAIERKRFLRKIDRAQLEHEEEEQRRRTSAASMYSLSMPQSAASTPRRTSQSSLRGSSSMQLDADGDEGFVETRRPTTVRLVHRVQTNEELELTSPDSTRHRHSAASRVKRGHWRKGEQIGKGAFAQVYRGLNSITGESIAIKEILFDEGAEKQVKALVRELETMRKLSHENIVDYHGGELEEGKLYIFCEWVAGGSVQTMIDKFGPFEETMVLRLARQSLVGLAYLHRMGVIHRDIKCANVLITADGVAKLADFGASQFLDTSLNDSCGDQADGSSGPTPGKGRRRTSLELSKTSKHIPLTGTPYFMAPEVILKTYVGRRSDIWSFGGFVLQMATGRAPWKALNFKGQLPLFTHIAHSEEDPLDVEERHWAEQPKTAPPRPLSKELRSFLRRCFHRNFAERPYAEELEAHPWLFSDMEVLSPGEESVDTDEEEEELLERIRSAPRRSQSARFSAPSVDPTEPRERGSSTPPEPTILTRQSTSASSTWSNASSASPAVTGTAGGAPAAVSIFPQWSAAAPTTLAPAAAGPSPRSARASAGDGGNNPFARRRKSSSLSNLTSPRSANTPVAPFTQHPGGTPNLSTPPPPAPTVRRGASDGAGTPGDAPGSGDQAQRRRSNPFARRRTLSASCITDVKPPASASDGGDQAAVPEPEPAADAAAAAAQKPKRRVSFADIPAAQKQETHGLKEHHFQTAIAHLMDDGGEDRMEESSTNSVGVEGS